MTPRALLARAWEATLATAALSLAAALVWAHLPPELSGGPPEGATAIPCYVSADGRIRFEVPPEVRERMRAGARR